MRILMCTPGEKYKKKKFVGKAEAMCEY